MIYFISTLALHVKIIILVALVKLYVLSHFWVDVPSLLFIFYLVLFRIIYSGQHPTFIQTLSPMQISNINFYFGSRFYGFCEDSEVIPMHQAFSRIGIRLQIKIVFMIIILIISCLPPCSLKFAHGKPRECLLPTLRPLYYSMKVSAFKPCIK